MTTGNVKFEMRKEKKDNSMNGCGGDAFIISAKTIIYC